jgi:signal peptidase I
MRCSPPRRLVQAAVLILFFLLLFRVIGVEPYQVPTGSMWPALAGNHRATNCPRCGYRVMVGRHRGEKDSSRDGDHFYRGAVCPNCGCNELGLDRVPECPGDHLLVNKSVFDFRRPRRWEMAVFRCPADPAKAFVKRIVGLPGETVQIKGGDIYINNRLARKTLAEFKALCIPVFDNNYQPAPDGFRDRWEPQPFRSESPLVGTELHLDGAEQPGAYQAVVYQHSGPGENQSSAIRDEYAYNGGDPRTQNAVHDLMMECDLHVAAGSGWVQFGITDGRDSFLAEMPVGKGPSSRADEQARLRQGRGSFAAEKEPSWVQVKVHARTPALFLQAGKTYHIELAFVDRRLSFAVDGAFPFAPLDLPAVRGRDEVTRPVCLGVKGVKAAVRNFRLFRDIYYTDAGGNGIHEGVPLGDGEYFVLGDNSPNSDDSRYWPNRGVVPEANFIGKPFLAHLPSRVVHRQGPGDCGERIMPDWGRIRWLR